MQSILWPRRIQKVTNVAVGALLTHVQLIRALLHSMQQVLPCRSRSIPGNPTSPSPCAAAAGCLLPSPIPPRAEERRRCCAERQSSLESSGGGRRGLRCALE
ncbi:Os05g0109650 [Oryza sativa Japonica Group]|uniref:Os05g0109650 protein n=1 Tax=Oryza sativa subsp. japonica TaxID=39947 RepID=A0A0P0WH23_ORYSJ|nr:Os05g0109650 [Oryza sativa Japonica Group]